MAMAHTPGLPSGKIIWANCSRRARPSKKMDIAPDSIALRTAWAADLPALQPLVERAIAELLAPFLSAEQLRASFEIMGLDTQLVADRTYFVAEFDGALAGCGGWSRRGTHFGGGHSPGRDARS